MKMKQAENRVKNNKRRLQLLLEQMEGAETMTGVKENLLFQDTVTIILETSVTKRAKQMATATNFARH